MFNVLMIKTKFIKYNLYYFVSYKIIVTFLSMKMTENIFKHIKCRNSLYPLSKIVRSNVPDEFVFWNTDFSDYKPINYDSPVLKNKDWADPDINSKNFTPKFNSLDGNVNRTSHCGNYEIIEKVPQNPFGRTGISGRGLLGRYGPNHAADPIVTRWKRTNEGEIVSNPATKKNILQMCAILRSDCNEWAIVGGMVDPGEKITSTLKREFMEEALSTTEDNSLMINKFFSSGYEIYKGYVDDPRNTDNAWMETIAVNFHDDNNNTVGKFNLSAGSDATKVKWLDLDSNIKLYASHFDIVRKVAERLNSHW